MRVIITRCLDVVGSMGEELAGSHGIFAVLAGAGCVEDAVISSVSFALGSLGEFERE